MNKQCAYTSEVSLAAACGLELRQHPPYSPDFTPSDFYLFPKVNRLASHDDVISFVFGQAN